MKTYIKTDRNGTKYYQESCTCWKCGGTGTYRWGMILNGVAQYAGVCYACGGTGKTIEKTKEYTPEYQAKLDAKKAKKEEARIAEIKAQQEAEAKRQAEWEAKKQAEREQSDFIGTAGEKIEMIVTYKFKAEFDTQFGTMHIFSMKDEAGNTLVWKTAGWLDPDNDNTHRGDKIRIKATIKEHNEYRGEKQTILTRVKVLEIVERAEEEA